jgi:hypothetical protein
MAPFNACSRSRGWFQNPRAKAAAIASLLACLYAVTGYPARAGDDQSLEYQVRAAFLLNFTKFVVWPRAAFAEEHSPLTICIMGEDPFGNTLGDMVKGESVNGHELMVQIIRRAAAPKSCQVLYVSKRGKDIPRILNEAGPGLLTVGEGEKFLQDGGIVAFVIDNRRVRFDVNQTAAAKAMLSISARLLNVARSVEK